MLVIVLIKEVIAAIENLNLTNLMTLKMNTRSIQSRLEKPRNKSKSGHIPTDLKIRT